MRYVFGLVGISVFGCLGSAAEVDFDTEIVPLLSKAGCNAANCHGGAAGQAGFRLSLFGGDPEFDYRSIVHELAGRRINHGQPTQSLLLAKPSGQLHHGGGQIWLPESKGAQQLAAWIAAGTPRLQLRQIDHLIVTPANFVGETVPVSFPVTVTAVFSDGWRRDVTQDAVYVSQNEAGLQVDDAGQATVMQPGRQGAVIRFAGHVQTVSVTTPLGSIRDLPATSATHNWIDEEINATLQSLRLAPAREADDATFVRRLSLDLTGRLPLPALVAQFVADKHPDKRARLADQLLDSDAFTAYWTHRLASQLRLRKPGGDEVAANAFYGWLEEQVAKDAPWTEIAAALIMSVGDTHQRSPATVHRFFATSREQAEYVSEVLMGVRLRCANCHNHPLDHWTQDDYHGLAAIFAGLERGKIVRFTGYGEVTHPRTGLAAVARIPGDRFVAAGLDPREEFVDWLIRKDNPYFAKAMAGRVWEALMGRGLVSPVDDLRTTNLASHPHLLERLAQFYLANDCRLRPLIRLICNSAAYRRISAPPLLAPVAPSADDVAENLVDDRFYSYAIAKPLAAEVLADAISDVTGVPDDYDGTPRAIGVVDRTLTAPKLQFLGQCLPGENCVTGGGGHRSIASHLHLMNGELLNEKINAADGRLNLALRSGVSTSELIHDFYLRAFSRPPSPQEAADWTDRIDDSADTPERAARWQDFLWALLTCHEFTTNW